MISEVDKCTSSDYVRVKSSSALLYKCTPEAATKALESRAAAKVARFLRSLVWKFEASQCQHKSVQNKTCPFS